MNLTAELMSAFSCRAVNVLPNRFLGVVGQHEQFPVENLTLSRGRDLLASCSHDQKIKFWNVEHVDKEEVDTSKRAKKTNKTKVLNKAMAKNDFFADLADAEAETSGAGADVGTTDSDSDSEDSGGSDMDSSSSEDDDDTAKGLSPNGALEATVPQVDDDSEQDSSDLSESDSDTWNWLLIKTLL